MKLNQVLSEAVLAENKARQAVEDQIEVIKKEVKALKKQIAQDADIMSQVTVKQLDYAFMLSKVKTANPAFASLKEKLANISALNRELKSLG
jgi:septal ring factor EnvC (AmiA/AmiB activator)